MGREIPHAGGREAPHGGGEYPHWVVEKATRRWRKNTHGGGREKRNESNTDHLQNSVVNEFAFQ